MQLFSMLAASAEEFSASGPPACSFHPSPWLYKDLQITFPCVFSYHVVIFTEEGMGRKPIISFILMSLSLLKTRGILIKSKASHTLFSKPSWILQFILKLKNTSLTMARRSHELKACFFPASSLSTLPLSLLLPRCLYYPSDMTVRLPPMGPLYLRSPCLERLSCNYRATVLSPSSLCYNVTPIKATQNIFLIQLERST